MSLINDALRRANADKQRESQSPAPVPPMQPVEPAPRSSAVLPWAVLVLGLGVLVVAASLWFRGQPAQTRQVAQNETTAPAVQTAEPKASAAPAVESASVPSPVEDQNARSASRIPEATAQVPPPVATPTTVPEVIPAAPVHSPSQAVTSESPESRAAAPRLSETKAGAAAPPQTRPAETPEPAKPKVPRLQAIYYRLRNPSVVLNGKTLSIGQSVDGIKVVSIQRTSVEVLHDGKYRTLTMQDPSGR